LQELEKESLIISNEERYTYPLYYANMESKTYKLLRQQNVVLRLEKSGLLETLEDYGPDAIIFFGSAAKGEDSETSDIDLYVLGDERTLNLTNYEIKLSRKINILFSKSFEKTSREFKNNIVNAIVVRGYLKVFKNEPLQTDHPRRTTRKKSRAASRRKSTRLRTH
jgi:predicted nucleotidyltransferase